MPEPTDRIKQLIEAAHRSIADCTAATAAMDVEMASRRPMLGLHPYAQRLAQRHDPNEEIEMDTGFLRCSCCEALTPIACACERPLYVKAGRKFVQRKGFDTREDVTRNVTIKRGRPKTGKALSAAERKRRQRAKRRR